MNRLFKTNITAAPAETLKSELLRFEMSKPQITRLKWVVIPTINTRLHNTNYDEARLSSGPTSRIR